MTQMFGHKWAANEGVSYDNGRPTKNFIRWCWETREFTREDWERAFIHTVKLKEQAAKEGTEEKCFPPDSVFFVAHSRPPAKIHRDFDKGKYLEYKEKALPKPENIKRLAAMRQATGV